MNLPVRFYKLFRCWSLDVVTGAVASGIFFINIFDVKMPLWWWFVLPTSVWVVYTLDHVLDGLKAKQKELSIDRHIYHFKNKKVLLLMIGIIVAINTIIVLFFMPFKMILWGAILLFLLGLYFIINIYLFGNNKFLTQKEFAIAVFYVAGVMLGPLFYKTGYPETWQIILTVVFVLLVWIEGIMASWFDYENDLHDGNISFAVIFGKRKTRYFLIFLIIMTFLLLKVTVFFITDFRQFAALIVEALMNLSLLLILLNPGIMKKGERYRVFGEMVFWLPFLLLVV